jgi:tight adherence protein B
VANAEAATEPALPVVRPGSLVQLTLWQQNVAFYLATLLILAGLGGVFLATRGARARGKSVLAEEHSDRPTETSTPALKGLADRAIELADRSLQGERGGRLNQQLDQAGVSMRPAEFAVLTAIGAIVGLALGYIIFGIAGGVVGAIVALIVIRFVIGRKADKRKAAFAEQLPDALHLMGGSLRSGFGLLQSIDVIAAESPSPTAEEFQRVKVEVQLGRDMDEALHAMAKRVGSEDFEWVSEGIQIHREVGGDIAEIIDSVTATIRSRNQIRRRIRSLSAEGRISAIVLVVLPIALFVIISLVNPAYIGELTTSSLGRTLIMGAVVGMMVGIVWIKRIIRLEF